ncbi:MAG: hypothetical protein P8K74_05485 [Flavobacteriaceae bacterium]|nr:hypothetical protein [Flavobacteriaceae bacterium]
MKKQLKDNPLVFSILGIGIILITRDSEINSDILRRALLVSGVIITALPVVYWINKKSKS